jgi:hypothetical protein
MYAYTKELIFCTVEATVMMCYAAKSSQLMRHYHAKPSVHRYSYS